MIQNKKIIKLITAAVMLAAVMLLTVSCAGKTKYEELDKNGYTVSVTFDPNGGTVKGTNSIVTDIYNLDDYEPDSDGMVSIPLLKPDDARRDPSNPLTVTNINHFLAGWYAKRTPVDENDLSKGYIYSDRWDFENDTLKVPADGDYSSADSQLTLYAAWIPYYTFEIYAKNSSGRFELLDTHEGINLTVPTWKDGEVTISMGNFPKRKGYTLDAVYLDRACTKLASETVTGGYDIATGVQTTSTVQLYTTWIEGDYYKIYDADDLIDNDSASATYEIMNDLDFTSKTWPKVFQNSKFSGTIIGNGHKIKGIRIESGTSSKLTNNGIFSNISKDAVIKDITFENVTHVIDKGVVSPGTSFGLLTGTYATGATFENVKITGKILIGDSCNRLDGADLTIGLVTGSGTPAGITANVVCEKQNPNNNKLKFEIAVDDQGFVELVFSK